MVTFHARIQKILSRGGGGGPTLKTFLFVLKLKQNKQKCCHFDNVFVCFVKVGPFNILVDEGRDDRTTTISGPTLNAGLVAL